MVQTLLREPQASEWDDIARLVATSIPHYIVSQLGPRFGAIYYRHIAGHPASCSLAAYDEADNIAGVILGTLDRQAARRFTLPVAARLLLAANFRLLSPAFLCWLARGGLSLMGVKKTKEDPRAELLILVLSPASRGEGLAPKLMDALEEFFCRAKRRQYLILTEKSNTAANRFYEKIGACLAQTNQHHGREINEWHKALP